MPRYKDWEEGSFRINIEVITDKGSKLEYYIPRLPVSLGEMFLAVCSVCYKEDRPLSYNKIIVEVRRWLNDLKEMKRKKKAL